MIEVSTGRLVARFEGDCSPVYGNRCVESVAFSEDGLAVVAKHYDGKVERKVLRP